MTGCLPICIILMNTVTQLEMVFTNCFHGNEWICYYYTMRVYHNRFILRYFLCQFYLTTGLFERAGAITQPDITIH